MADQDRPPIMVPWINSPRLRRFEAWLWNRPKTAMALTAVSFVLISSPVWFADFWSLFSNDAPVPVMMDWISRLPPLTVSWYWLPVGLGAAMLTIILLVFWRERKRLEAENVGLKAEILQKSLPVPTPISEAKEVHAECEKKIARLRESEEKHATRATVHENALKTFKKEYAVPIAVADNQKAEIGKCLEVLRVCTHDPKLDDPMPTIKWAILFKNRSVHRISLEQRGWASVFRGSQIN